MHDFELLIERGRRHFEVGASRKRFLTSSIVLLIPASILLLAQFYWFRWDLFLLAVAGPLLIIPLWNRLPRRLDPKVTARWFDQEHAFKDTLSTALEFSSREVESPIFRDLSEDADRRARLVQLPEPGKMEWIIPLILAAIFLLLLLAHLWTFLPRDTIGRAISDLEKLMHDAATDPDTDKELRDSLDAVKKAMGTKPETGTKTATGTGTGTGTETGTNDGANSGTGSRPGSGSGKGTSTATGDSTGSGNGNNSGKGSGKGGSTNDASGNASSGARGNAQGRAAALSRLQDAISKADPTESLKQLGRDLSGAPVAAGLANELAKGDAANAAKTARNDLGKKLEKGLDAASKKELERALQQGIENLPEKGSQGLKKALEEMKNSLNKPGEAKKAADDLGKQLEKLSKQQDAVREMEKKLEELKQKNQADQGSKSGQDKDSGKDGKDGKDGKSGKDGKGSKSGKDGKGGNDGRNGKGGKGGKDGQDGKDGKNGQSARNGNSSQMGKNTQNGKGGPNSMNGKGGKAGGELNDDPLERMKKKGQKPLNNNESDPNDPFAMDAVASQPQSDFDYDKGPLLTDREKKQMQLTAESMAKSREIDEFARHHRIPESFRSYLKDFFNP
ncbi:MAG: hypothetical protein WA705_00715 [Candidatus Ozemobacteraceae bacterium]